MRRAGGPKRMKRTKETEQNEILSWLDEKAEEIAHADTTETDVATLLARAEREDRQREEAKRQVADLTELLEEVLAERGNSHREDCEKRPCDCGLASLHKARRLVAKITL